jgi:hypothetical protein
MIAQRIVAGGVIGAIVGLAIGYFEVAPMRGTTGQLS